MFKRFSVVSLLLVGLVLTGCSSSHSSFPAQAVTSNGVIYGGPPVTQSASPASVTVSSPTPTPVASSSGPVTVADLAAKLGCTPSPSGTKPSNALDEEVCKLKDGHTVYLVTFATNDDRDAYGALGKSEGGTFVDGNLWLAGGIGLSTDDLKPLR